jgi:uncharacterized protein
MPVSEAAQPMVDYLRGHNAATLATCGPDGPWAAAVFYAHDDDLTLYFLTDPATHHGRDLATNAQVAATIQEDYHDWRRIKGIQLVGKAELVAGPLELARAWRLYLSKFPFVKDFLGAPGEFLDAYAGKMGKVRFYKLTPAKIWFSDNERHFGRRDVLDCATGEVVLARV